MRRWDVLAKLILDGGYKSYVEVGCKEGRTTGHILSTCPGVMVYACDPWTVQPATADPTAETYDDWDFAAIEREFRELTDPHKERLTFHRTTGLEMSRTIDDESVDLVFLDARHDYESVLEDISVWYGKVRPGGWLCGHDFNHKWPGVMAAVADQFDLMQVTALPDSVWAHHIIPRI